MSATAPADSPRSFTEGFRALRHRDFRLYFGGQFVSLIGTWMQSVAQGWLMHRLTSSPMMLGLLSFAQFIPVLPLALYAGVIADRIPRRRLLLWTQSLQLLQAVLLALAVATNIVQPWMVLVLALMYGIVNTLDLPARQSFVVDLTGKDDLPNGIALNSAAFNAARILGPAVAGILVASVGEAGCFAFNALSFVAVIVSLLLMRPALAPAADPTRARASVSDRLRDGLAYAWATPTIRQLLVLLAICAGFGFQYNVLLPVYARDVLHAGSYEYGWLFSAFGAGSLIAALRMAVTRERWALRRHLLVGLVTGSAGLLGFAWVHTLPAMIGFAALAGFGLILYVASTNTLIQLTVEDSYRGRVMSLYTLFFVGTAPFGALLAGFIAQHLGAPVATSVSAAVLLGGAVWVGLRLREIAAREAAAAAAVGTAAS
ncbi:MAG: MFS transporter [Candidatus Eisenbacteria bacterium]|nr:MFS transporter [Candidatus Eisenbacteria bacterium]